MPPRIFLVAPLMACVLLAATYAPLQAQAEDIRITTTRQSPVFAGPGEPYPLLITFGNGVTLPVLARSEDSRWLIIALGPFREGWIAAADGEMSAGVSELSVRSPDLTFLPTPTPDKPKLRVSVTLKPANKNTAALTISLSGVQELAEYDIVVYDSNGKEMANASVKGYYGPRFVNFGPGSFPPGTYSVRVTSSTGEVAGTQFTLTKP